MANKDPKNKIVRVRLKTTKQYLRVLNGMFELTDKELTVLASFLNKYKELKALGISVFSAEVKKQIAEELDIDDFNTLNVYVKRLKDKNALIYQSGGGYKFNPLVLKKDNEKRIIFEWQESKN